ncbi:MAG: ABC transporter ATP-binding protein [Phycisphaerae bacterium]
MHSATSNRQDGALLQVRGLRSYFFTEQGVVRAVDGVSWTIQPGQTLALVGESGCGKTVAALSIMRLIPSPPGRIVAGQILFQGQNLLSLPEHQMRRIRGNRIAMVFQEPMTSLNPVYTIGNQIAEAVELHQGITGQAAWDRAVEMLARVGMPEPAQRARQWPHQLSGGMRQRVMIAMALSCTPALLIADEPTTALDVTIQAQILELLQDLQHRLGMAILLITHDLGVVASLAEQVCVMYASKIVETADVNELFANPLHPYSQGLFRSIPRLSQARQRLEVIPGTVPDPLAFPSGCKFHPRCPLGSGDRHCQTVEPTLRQISPAHHAACWKVRGYESARPSEEPAP